MKGLLFIEPLYNQTIKGLKTMTRREGSLKAINDNPDEWKEYNVHYEIFKGIVRIDFENKNGHKITLKPRLFVGDVCCLKEPYTVFHNLNTDEKIYEYKFNTNASEIPYKNKMFMPASAARAFVKITSVKCERLLDISDEDCIAEGIEKVENPIWTKVAYKNYLRDKDTVHSQLRFPKDSFLSLFKFANKIKADAEVKNIWVWVYGYVLCDKDGKEITNG